MEFDDGDWVVADGAIEGDWVIADGDEGAVSGVFFHAAASRPAYAPFGRCPRLLPDPALSFLPPAVSVRSSSHGLLLCRSAWSTYYVCDLVTARRTPIPRPPIPHPFFPSPALVLVSRPDSPSLFHLVCPLECGTDGATAYRFETFSSATGEWRSDAELFRTDPIVPASGVGRLRCIGRRRGLLADGHAGGARVRSGRRRRPDHPDTRLERRTLAAGGGRRRAAVLRAGDGVRRGDPRTGAVGQVDPSWAVRRGGGCRRRGEVGGRRADFVPGDAAAAEIPERESRGGAVGGRAGGGGGPGEPVGEGAPARRAGAEAGRGGVRGARPRAHLMLPDVTRISFSSLALSPPRFRPHHPSGTPEGRF